LKTIVVDSKIIAPISKVWQYWTLPEHIMNWNFASSDWHCPKAENNLVVGGEFHYLMAAKDESFSFDFWGTYQKIEKEKGIDILLGDGRNMSVYFEETPEGTIVTESFEPESENSPELQKAGWQAILDNFKQCVESNILR
jgi:uncharacterized protein YndB with AHSA1/START domain